MKNPVLFPTYVIHGNLFVIFAQTCLNRKMQYSLPDTLRWDVNVIKIFELRVQIPKVKIFFLLRLWLIYDLNTQSVYFLKLNFACLCICWSSSLIHWSNFSPKNFVFLRIIIVVIIDDHPTVVINGCFFFQEDDCSVQLEWKNAAACRLLDLSHRSISLLPNASTRK